MNDAATDPRQTIADLQRKLAECAAERDELLRQRTATADVLKIISRAAFDLESALVSVCETAARLCDADQAAIYRREGDLFRFVAAVGFPREYADAWRAAGAFPVDPKSSLVGHRAIAERRPVQVLDVTADPDFRASTSRGAQARTALGIPLMREGEPVGNFVLARKRVEAFTDRQLELMQTFADQAVIAIENTRLFNETQEALQQQKASADILSVISNSVADPKPVFDKILRSIEHLFGADERFVFLVGDDGLLHIGAVHGPNAERAHALFPVPLQGSVSEVAIRERRLVKLADVFNDPDVPPVLREVAHRFGKNYSMVVAPMLWEDRAIGSIFVGRTSMELFSEKECDLLRTFADQAVIAIQNARLFEQVQTKSRNLEDSLQQQTATADVLKIISRSVAHAAPVFDTILESCQRLFDPYDAAVYLVEGDRVRGVAQRGAGAGDWGTDSMPLEGSSTGAAIAQRQPLHFPDLADKAGLPEDKRAALQQTGGMTVLYAPMISQDRGVGSLVVTRRPKKPFTRTEIDLIQTFADQAVIAIENARLFEQVQTKTRNLEESLQQQTATAEVLKVISRSAFDLQVVFDTLVQSAARLCEAESAFIFQHDGEVYRLKSSVGFQPGFRDFMARHPIEVGRGTLVGRTALTRDIVHIPDVLTDPDYAWSESRQLGGYRTMLGVPLLRGGIPVGVLAMTRDQPRPFTSKQVELVQTFADQAVIAIENARLFDEVQARTRDLGEALEQQTATADVLKIISRSAFDLQAVLDTLTTSAVNLLGMRSGTICVRDGGVFRYRSAAGAFWTEELWRYLQDHPVVPGRSTAAGRAILSGHIEQIPDILDDAEYGIPMQALTSEQFPRAMLSVPLLGKDRIEGAMVLSRQHPGPFTQREVDILQTFADQAVIAIDNTRLFNETREALERQTATADILKVIASSPSNAQPVFEAIASSANRLIGGFSTAVHLIVNDMVHLVAFTPTNPEADAILVAAHPRHRSEVPAVALVENGEIAQIADSETADAHIRQIGRARGWRSVTLTPLMNRRNFIGFMASTRRETGVLGNHQVELLRTFSDQAVIAIENARLFNELQARTRDLSRSLDDLRTAQDRLVQTEKLASLGQLTAGIAHEIKNPLNFINNFAALSVELTDELLDVLKPAPLDAMMRGDVDELTHMLKGNLDKVTQHGRRADSIVRNMLLHSREGTGEHRPADINALVEESLNLAYHGARAEKPGFNITLQRAFDPAAGEIELFPQEITRVLLNLITNGFYATARRKAEAGDGFEPVLSAATRTLGDRVEIRIRDNGTGIPPEVREKIFNPFFTTKPAGEGTGLGLSMSHDIIVKQHGGTIDVETEPGAFTEFIVTLPRAGAAAPETGGLK